MKLHIVSDSQRPGVFLVVDSSDVHKILFEGTNAACWLFIDRAEGEPINPSEKKWAYFQSQEGL